MYAVESLDEVVKFGTEVIETTSILCVDVAARDGIAESVDIMRVKKASQAAALQAEHIVDSFSRYSTEMERWNGILE